MHTICGIRPRLDHARSSLIARRCVPSQVHRLDSQRADLCLSHDADIEGYRRKRNRKGRVTDRSKHFSWRGDDSRSFTRSKLIAAWSFTRHDGRSKSLTASICQWRGEPPPRGRAIASRSREEIGGAWLGAAHCSGGRSRGVSTMCLLSIHNRDPHGWLFPNTCLRNRSGASPRGERAAAGGGRERGRGPRVRKYENASSRTMRRIRSFFLSLSCNAPSFQPSDQPPAVIFSSFSRRIACPSYPSGSSGSSITMLKRYRARTLVSNTHIHTYAHIYICIWRARARARKCHALGLGSGARDETSKRANTLARTHAPPSDAADALRTVRRIEAIRSALSTERSLSFGATGVR